MRNYDVKIRETLEMTVTVEAESMAKAKEIVEQKWKNSDYLLDASHFQGVVISPLYPYNKDYAR